MVLRWFREAENQIITPYEVFAERPKDSQLLVSSGRTHQRRLGALHECKLPTQVLQSKEREDHPEWE